MPAPVQQDEAMLVQVQTRSSSSTRSNNSRNEGMFGADSSSPPPASLELTIDAAASSSSSSDLHKFSPSSPRPSPSYRPVMISIHPEMVRLVAYAMFWGMVLIAVIITKAFVKEDLSVSPLVNMFGYNNICIMWDYEPATSAVAMVYPAVEVPLVLYLLLNFLRVREAYRAGMISRTRFGVCCAMFPAELTFILWFRMIFVVKAFVNVQGHTMGFHGLMLALCMVALQNHLYHDSIGKLVAPQWVSISYLVALYAVTLAKFVIVWAIFAGSPLWTTSSKAGNDAAQALDILWMILASVLPAGFAWKNRHLTPAMELSFGLQPRSSNSGNQAVDLEAVSKQVQMDKLQLQQVVPV